MGKLERAKIYVLEGDGSTDKKVEADTIDVCINPKEYSLEKSVSWKSEKAQTDAPLPEFTEPSPMSLSVTLQFDTYEERISVRDKYTKKLEKLVFMRDKLGKNPKPEQKKKAMPAVIIFVWGRFSFKGVIESLSQKYTMFLSDGTPVRAECALKIRNVYTTTYDDDKKGSYSSAAGSDTGGSHTVVKGDRLDSIAAQKLNDASRWPEIAALNDIDNPADLKEGTALKLPS
jgi:hypothetical protein